MMWSGRFGIAVFHGVVNVFLAFRLAYLCKMAVCMCKAFLYYDVKVVCCPTSTHVAAMPHLCPYGQRKTMKNFANRLKYGNFAPAYYKIVE